MQTAPPTPKGFRDIQPQYAKKRREVINTIAPILEENGFAPIETPTIEFAETLTGKYGDEEKLIYKFTDRGDRELALRYDLTVPLARFIANNQNLLTPTFSRYQIGQVFRGENPQHGRYREFTQFDFDTVGSTDFAEDVKVISTAIKSIRKLGLKDAQMAINDRNVFNSINPTIVRLIDKIHKVGKEKIEEEMKKTGFSDKEISVLANIHKTSKSPNTQLIFLALERHGLIEDKDFFFDPTLARGLDYYTGTIFELKPSKNPASLSIGAGGRYDNLIGMFAKKQIPAVGFSFGLDRIVDQLLNV